MTHSDLPFGLTADLKQMGAPVLIDPPPCPPWCQSRHSQIDRGWDVSPGDITRTCGRLIDVQTCEQAHEVALERFAYIDLHGGALHIEDAIVRLDGGDPMHLDEVLLLSDCLRRAVDIIGESVLAA